MWNATLTFAWTSWRQHRIGLLIAFYVLMMAGIASWFVVPVSRTTLFIRESTLILEFVGVAAACVMCLMSVFSYGDFQADIMARASGFPSNLLRLPVPTSSLVIWPMFYGAALPAVLWIGVVGLTIRPLQRPEDFTPLWWPAAFAAASVAWLQVLLWLPFGLRGLRVVLVFVVGAALIEIVVSLYEANIPEMERTLALGGLTVVAWVLGYAGVRQARHGKVPDWEWIVAPIGKLFERGAASQTVLVSATKGNEWIQWKIWGQWLPILTGVMIAAGIAPMFIYIDMITALPSLLAVPILVAGFAGLGAGGKSKWAGDRSGISTLIATRPISDSALIRGVFKVATRSTLTTWMLTLPLVTLLPLVAVLLTDRGDPAAAFSLRQVAAMWRTTLENFQSEPTQVASGWAAITVLLIFWTWKRTVNSYVVGLVGRGWLFVEACLWFAGGIASALLVRFLNHMGLRVSEPEFWPWFWTVFLLVRMGVALWVLRLAVQTGTIAPRTIARWLAVWLVLAISVIGLIAAAPWAATEHRNPPIAHVILLVLFAFPMVRLAAAPLILAKVRHR